MKNKKALLVACFHLVMLGAASVSAEDISSEGTSCQAFNSVRADYTDSLAKDDTGKPMASEQSVQLAWTLVGAAEACLSERQVPFERISTYTLRITPDQVAEPGKTAALIDGMTKGSVIYDVGFFLRKPYAAGGFEHNILYLPHSAVTGKIDMITRHELTHARAHALKLNDDIRLRHLWLFADDAMFVDEVLAYADGGINADNEERMRIWSREMAHQYIAGTRKLLEAPDAKVAIEQHGKRCPVTSALKKEVTVMLACIEGVISSEDGQPAAVAQCDGPRTQASVC